LLIEANGVFELNCETKQMFLIYTLSSGNSFLSSPAPLFRYQAYHRKHSSCEFIRRIISLLDNWRSTKGRANILFV